MSRLRVNKHTIAMKPKSPQSPPPPQPRQPLTSSAISAVEISVLDAFRTVCDHHRGIREVCGPALRSSGPRAGIEALARVFACDQLGRQVLRARNGPERFFHVSTFAIKLMGSSFPEHRKQIDNEQDGLHEVFWCAIDLFGDAPGQHSLPEVQHYSRPVRLFSLSDFRFCLCAPFAADSTPTPPAPQPALPQGRRPARRPSRPANARKHQPQ